MADNRMLLSSFILQEEETQEDHMKDGNEGKNNPDSNKNKTTF
jgi:hypothetical protein